MSWAWWRQAPLLWSWSHPSTCQQSGWSLSLRSFRRTRTDLQFDAWTKTRVRIWDQGCYARAMGTDTSSRKTSPLRRIALLVGVLAAVGSVPFLLPDTAVRDSALQQVPEQSELPTLHLTVAPSDLQLMRHAIEHGDRKLKRKPGGHKPYVPAVYRDESGVDQQACVSYRGASHWHHAPEKPSFRVRIRKREIRRGHRHVELSRPEDVVAMRNWLPEELGRELGLMTALRDHVRLFVNGEYYGVYVRHVRPGNSMAVAQGQMPGTFFKGDNLTRDTTRDLWQSARNWRQRGDAGPETVALLEHALTTMRTPPSAEALQELQSVIDVESFARYSALMAVTGGLHTDRDHNHVLYASSRVRSLGRQRLRHSCPTQCSGR